MTVSKLTKRNIDTAPIGDHDQFLWDSEVDGFGIRIWPSGRKTFLAKYRVGGGRSAATRRFSIGTYGVLMVEEARAAAKYGARRRGLGC